MNEVNVMYKAPSEATILRNYEDAKEFYASLGLDTEKAIADFQKGCRHELDRRDG